MQIFHNKCFNYIWAVRINIHERIITYKVWVKMPCLLTFIMSHVCMFGCCCCRDDKSTVNSRQIVNIFTFSAQIADNQCYWKASFTNKIDILSKRFDHFILISSPSWKESNKRCLTVLYHDRMLSIRNKIAFQTDVRHVVTM